VNGQHDNLQHCLWKLLTDCPNQAAALALEARNDGITGIVAQVLHFPTVCHPKFFPTEKYELGSMKQNAKNPVLSAWMWEAFLDAYTPHAEPDSMHSPLLATSHRDLPPARKSKAADSFSYSL
jgi:hypothetical protein